jgi:hypothetical protein
MIKQNRDGRRGTEQSNGDSYQAAPRRGDDLLKRVRQRGQIRRRAFILVSLFCIAVWAAFLLYLIW